MQIPKEERCCEQVRNEGRWPSFHQCYRRATTEHYGKKYCKIHDPVALEAKREAQEKQWREKWRLQELEHQKQTARRAVVDAAVEWRKGGKIGTLEKAIDRLIALVEGKGR